MPVVMQSKKIRVLCVDDSPDMSSILSRFVRDQPDLEDVGALECADDVVSEVERRQAGVVVMDLTMPGLSPLAAIRELATRFTWCRVIAFSGYEDPRTVKAALDAGAREVVSKHGEPGDILEAIRRVAAA